MFRKLIKYLKDYFTFNKSERRGLLVLSIFIVILIILNMIMPLLVPKKNYDYSKFDKDVSEFLKTQEVVTAKPKTYRQKEPFNIFDAGTSAAEQKLNPFTFDPNTLSYEGLIELGLTAKQAMTVVKFRVKGGKFFKKEDFSKIYGISEKEYRVLEPFIEIIHEEQAVTKKTSAIPALLVELNTASEEELLKIKGIGEYFAAQIIKYRNRLGGFNNKEQLLEVPKIDSTRYAEISPFIEVNTKAVRRINVNTATFEQLKQHPYIGYNIALSLINYRTKHGLFNSLEDIKKSALITNQNFPKISYYLCID